MNLEDLTKTQIILLTMLVAFVTSIATGITTVALLEEVPPTITSSVSRVIQNTVEKTIQTDGGRTQTIVVKEDDLIVDAIAEANKSLVLVRENVGGTPGVALASGFAVSKDGLVVTDGSRMYGYTKFAVTSAGATYPAELVFADPRGFSILRITATQDAEGFKSFVPATFAASAVRAGQTIVAAGLADSGTLRIAKGIVTRADTDEPFAVSFSTGIPTAGSILLDTSGEAAGLALVAGEPRAVPIAAIAEALTELAKAQ